MLCTFFLDFVLPPPGSFCNQFHIGNNQSAKQLIHGKQKQRKDIDEGVLNVQGSLHAKREYHIEDSAPIVRVSQQEAPYDLSKRHHEEIFISYNRYILID